MGFKFGVYLHNVNAWEKRMLVTTAAAATAPSVAAFATVVGNLLFFSARLMLFFRFKKLLNIPRIMCKTSKSKSITSAMQMRTPFRLNFIHNELPLQSIRISK